MSTPSPLHESPQFKIIPANTRGQADFGWLKARYSFSFGEYQNPSSMGFSTLRVLNEDVVQPSRGFGAHPHRNMEILTYVISGQLQHQDSMGNGSIIQAGDIQLMSAGSGITHSEINPSDTQAVHLLQIWIYPKNRGTEPRYQQAHIAEIDKLNRFCILASPNGEQNSLEIDQDVFIYAGIFDRSSSLASIKTPWQQQRCAYLHLIKGSMTLLLNGQIQVLLSAGDALQIEQATSIEIIEVIENTSEILWFDLNKE
jgi:redox-sensitive bicupin YhaK (pirin superfamily)